jgi:hypothetical protein
MAHDTMAHNLTRAAGALAGGRHRCTRTGTIRPQLIHTPARIAHSAHRQLLHLPRAWPWQTGLDELFRRALHDLWVPRTVPRPLTSAFAASRPISQSPSAARAA